MLNKYAASLWLFATVVFACCVGYFLFPGLLTPGGYLVPVTGADGGKNLLAFEYHLLHSNGWWCMGMNYPYGEHIVFTDGLPLLSMLLAKLGVTDFSVALSVLWKVIVLSYVLSIVYLFRILLRFRVHPVCAMICAGLITCMCPQLMRTMGHFSLSLACVVPMTFYWILCHYKRPSYSYGIYIFMLAVVAAFFTPYLIALMAVLVGFYYIGYLFFTVGNLKTKVLSQLPLLVGLIAALMTFNIVMMVTDPVKDRPKTPYGVTAFCTTGNHIFTSPHSPFWNSLNVTEGEAYLGVVTLSTMLGLLLAWLWRVRNKRKENDADTDPILRIMLFVSLASLVLAMGVPFVWGMEGLVEYLPFIRQFRTLGRFSWIFYFIITLYSVIAIYRWYIVLLKDGRIAFAYLFLFLVVGIWSFEASGFVNHERASIKAARSNYDRVIGKSGRNWKRFIESHGYKSTDFQAVLLLTYFHVGMDKLWHGGLATDQGIEAGFETAIQLGLPMVDAMLSRSSWSITQKQVKTVGGPYVGKPMLNDLPNRKPFLLLNMDGDELGPDQAYLLTASYAIGKLGQWNAYACFPDRLMANDRRNRDSVLAIAAALPVGDTCIGCSSSWFADHFDNGSSKESFSGRAAQAYINIHDTVIAEIAMTTAVDNQLYECSCWFLLGDNNYRSPYLVIEQLNVNGGVIRSTAMLTKTSADNHGLWFRSSVFFAVSKECASIRVQLFNEPTHTYKVLDDFLLRPAASLIISKAPDGKLMVNNHLM